MVGPQSVLTGQIVGSWAGQWVSCLGHWVCAIGHSVGAAGQWV
jgi:hypothetical protein